VASRAARAAYRFNSSAAVSRTCGPRGARARSHSPPPSALPAAQRPDRRHVTPDQVQSRTGTYSLASFAYCRCRNSVVLLQDPAPPVPGSARFRAHVHDRSPVRSSATIAHDRIDVGWRGLVECGAGGADWPHTARPRSPRQSRRPARRIPGATAPFPASAARRSRRSPRSVRQSVKGKRDSDSICDIVSRRTGDRPPAAHGRQTVRTIRAAAGPDRALASTASRGKARSPV